MVAKAYAVALWELLAQPYAAVQQVLRVQLYVVVLPVKRLAVWWVRVLLQPVPEYQPVREHLLPAVRYTPVRAVPAAVLIIVAL